ncbi:hypothetical protein SHO565_74010 [Streptomyces sp. HO565]
MMHVRCPDRLPEIYRHVLELPAGLSPVVQALPPSAAMVELKGALRYHGTDAAPLGEVLRIRRPGRHRADDHRRGHRLRPGRRSRRSPRLAPDQVAGWLAPLPVEVLHGVGPARRPCSVTTASTRSDCSPVGRQQTTTFSPVRT